MTILPMWVTSLSGSPLSFAVRASKKRIGYEAEIRGCLSIIFSELVRRLTGGNRPPCRIPSGILEYIDANLGEKLTAEKIAERCFYNPNYLSEVFRKTYGMTLKDYIRRQEGQRGGAPSAGSPTCRSTR